MNRKPFVGAWLAMSAAKHGTNLKGLNHRSARRTWQAMPLQTASDSLFENGADLGVAYFFFRLAWGKIFLARKIIFLAGEFFPQARRKKK